MKKMPMAAGLIWGFLCALPVATQETAPVPGDLSPFEKPYERPVAADAESWQRFSKPLLDGFGNMYQPCVLERPGEPYPYRMWFFGWAHADCNPGFPGCDAIFFARSKNLTDWEVYAGPGRWDTKMNAETWHPVLAASDRFYDTWHNGDPSVVWKDGRYYMAYSATSEPNFKKTVKHLDGLLCCIMGATSDDGIHWEKTAQPLLIEPEYVQQALTDTEYPCDFHRPCLRWEEGRWRLWFDYWCPPHGVCMGHAENTGAFGAPDGFTPTHALAEPLIYNWPNPDVVRMEDGYLSFADPTGYGPARGGPDEGWKSRALCEAVSQDGIEWHIRGYIPPDKDTAACHVPQALVTEQDGRPWLYLFYATQRGRSSDSRLYDYRYDRIRAMRRPMGKE